MNVEMYIITTVCPIGQVVCVKTFKSEVIVSINQVNVFDVILTDNLQYQSYYCQYHSVRSKGKMYALLTIYLMKTVTLPSLSP